MMRTGPFCKGPSQFKFCPICGNPLCEEPEGLICTKDCDVTWTREMNGRVNESYWGSWTWQITGKVWGTA